MIILNSVINAIDVKYSLLSDFLENYHFSPHPYVKLCTSRLCIDSHSLLFNSHLCRLQYRVIRNRCFQNLKENIDYWRCLFGKACSFMIASNLLEQSYPNSPQRILRPSIYVGSNISVTPARTMIASSSNNCTSLLRIYLPRNKERQYNFLSRVPMLYVIDNMHFLSRHEIMHTERVRVNER